MFDSSRENSRTSGQKNPAEIKVSKPFDVGPHQNAGLISKNDLSQRIRGGLPWIGQLRDSQGGAMDVGFGSLADIGTRPDHVRFTPKSGHRD